MNDTDFASLMNWDGTNADAGNAPAPRQMEPSVSQPAAPAGVSLVAASANTALHGGVSSASPAFVTTVDPNASNNLAQLQQSFLAQQMAIGTLGHANPAAFSATAMPQFVVQAQQQTAPVTTMPNGNASLSGDSANTFGAPVTVTDSSSVCKSTTSSATGMTLAPLHPTPQSVDTSKTTKQLHSSAISSSVTYPPNAAGAFPIIALPASLQGTSFLPTMFNPLLQSSAVASGNPQLLAMIQQQQQQQPQVPLVAAPVVAPVKPAPSAVSVVCATTTGLSSVSTASAAPSAASVVTARPAKPKHSSASSKAKSTKSKEKNAQKLPPFYLFDAPCELRTNFLQSQRMYNMPTLEDDNSVHYGMAVNGFHPQMNAQIQPMSFKAYTPGASVPIDRNVKLIDGRGKRSRTGKDRNEREQKRAAKITELIDKLRVNMEKGGWKVEMKSKYHTLATCSDYVKHLIATTKMKEEAVEKAKSDLEMKEHKLEEKQLAESRSDPESVMSTLTSSSRGNESEPRGPRKVRVVDAEDAKKPTDGSKGDSSNADEQEGVSRRVGRNISFNKTSSSISDVTESNRGSSELQRRANEDEGGTQSSGSISSTAAVARGTGSRECEHGHADVVIKVKKKKRRSSRRRKTVDPEIQEITSIESNFELDMEEVFVQSNVPQLIATPAGRIVTWNDFFLKSTGLTADKLERLTIFSLVKQDKLSSLFQIVAEALHHQDSPRNDCESSSSGHTTGASGSSTDGSSANRGGDRPFGDYSTVTLPCVSFPSEKDSEATHHPNPLYMTVTLMPDEDPHKRCFHCVLTDCPGTDGALGFVTPELLSMLFTGREPSEPTEPPAKRQKVAATDDGNSDESNGMQVDRIVAGTAVSIDE